MKKKDGEDEHDISKKGHQALGVKKILGVALLMRSREGAERVTAVGVARFVGSFVAGLRLWEARDRRSRGTGTPALRFSAVELEPHLSMSFLPGFQRYRFPLWELGKKNEK